MNEIDNTVIKLTEEYTSAMLKDYHSLHRIPELSFQEYETTEYIRKRLEEMDIQILDYGLETGVAGYLEGSGSGPCIGLRADIDGLPVSETKRETGEEGFVLSEHPGIMHACGHDTHMASLLGAARVLIRMREQINGSVKFLFQPAEEVSRGSTYMIDRGVLQNPKVDMLFGLHNAPSIPTGTVGVRKGPLMAAVINFEIRIRGTGGHGALPHTTRDPIVCAAAVIQSVQTIVSRSIDPFHPAVVSICSIQGGQGMTNVTPDTVTMKGTARAFHEEDMDQIRRRMDQIVTGTAEAYGCTAELDFPLDLGATGSEQLYDLALDAAGAVAEPVDPPASMAGEDFAFYQDTGIPTFFYFLGIRNEAKGCIYPLHSPRYLADPDCLPIGAGIYALSVFRGIDYIRSTKA